jgi:hypothetical protein
MIDPQDEIQPQEQVQPEANPNSAHPLLYALLGVVIFAAAAFAGYTLVPYFRGVEMEVPPPPTSIPQPIPEVEEPEPQEPVAGTLSIQWQEPERIDSLQLFLPINEYRDQASRYYLVGTVEAGVYQGADVILLSAPFEGPAFYPGHYHFLRQGNDLILLTQHSAVIYEGESFDLTKFSQNDGLMIEELADIPSEIRGPGARQILKRDEYVNAMFTTDGLVKMFTNSLVGDVYTTQGFPEDYGPINNRHGFYARAANGTMIVYAYYPDFLYKPMAESMEIPDITFEDGMRNKVNYTFATIGGCGATNYASVVDPALVSMDALVSVGTTSKGDTIYALKDKEHPLLRDMYENEYTYFPENEEKAAYEDFVASHPIIYYVDPFGRLQQGKSDAYLPAVECGKPVIYLYPETTQEISVQVEPQGGFTYTDPEYGNGWKVIATPQGELTEVSSGLPYPYLFWEGRGGIYSTPDKGFVVAVGEVETFLVKSLGELGLNEKEIADFNEFWLPRMQDAPYYFITFLGNSTMDALAPLTIEPQPDTVIRVLMDFLPLEQPIEVQGYPLRSTERKGFTVVEWGGVIR